MRNAACRIEKAIGAELQGKSQTIEQFFEADEGEKVKTKVVCPMAAIMNCIEDKCAWYVSERDACAVKVIAIGKR